MVVEEPRIDGAAEENLASLPPSASPLPALEARARLRGRGDDDRRAEQRADREKSMESHDGSCPFTGDAPATGTTASAVPRVGADNPAGSERCPERRGRDAPRRRANCPTLTESSGATERTPSLMPPRRLTVAVLLALALGVPSVALARSSGIYDYTLEVSPHADGTAHFKMRILWDGFIDAPLGDGLQYVGFAEPRSVLAYDDDGTPLAVSVVKHPRRPGWAIHYALAAPREPGGRMQEAVIEFDQTLDTTPWNYTWGGATTILPWTPELDSRPVYSHYRVFSETAAGLDFTCSDDPGGQRCERDMGAPDRLEFVLRPPSAARLASDLGALALALLLSASTLAGALRSLRRRALRERGVVPEDARPSGFQAGYRAPPPRAAAELSVKDRLALQRSRRVVVLALAATSLPTLLLRRAPIPIGVFAGFVTLGGALFLLAFLHARRARHLLAATPVVVSIAHVAFGGVAACVTGAAALVLYALARRRVRGLNGRSRAG